jgi:hypothetical protein
LTAVIGHRVRGGAWSAALIALSIFVDPAAAERVQARLSVEAIVLPSCLVTTSTTNSTAFCTPGERPLVTVNPASGAQPVIGVDGAQAASPGAVKVITLTY